tara:strand:+ start:28 stop:459 length:432 start_codon:yes stop_codon:yes gene_type:complete
MNKILSYRNLIATDAQDTILLSTKKGEKGYRITKLQLIGQQPSAVSQEGTLKIFTVPPDSVSSTINFSDNTLIAAGFYESDSTAAQIENTTIIFDSAIFNQDITITMKGTGSTSLNYYLEVEVIPLNEMEAMVATLKDIRNSQ